MQLGAPIAATLVRGHRVASGLGGDARFPDGTLALQIPHFADRGLDLTPFYRGTLNLSIAPWRYEVRSPRLTFRNLHWSEIAPPEDFSFFDCQLTIGDDRQSTVAGLIYYPHPDTKPEHFQAEDTLEILAPRIDGLSYGDRVAISVDEQQMRFV